MSATATHGQAERAELEAILSSGIFSRSPSLATFLRFVCERYLEGNTDGLKEYCIAVEALKRPPGFDQKKDAIVRVEAYRLRKRLAEYYQNEGAAHAIQIEIPSGQYAPRFVYRTKDAVAEAALPAVPEEIVSPPVPEVAAPVPQGRRFRRAVFIGLAAVLLVVLVVWQIKSRQRSQPPGEVWHGSASLPVSGDFRMLAGYHGRPFSDRQGRIWLPDAYYKGGVSVRLPDHRRFEGLPDPNFAAWERLGDFEYAIPVSPGSYEVHLHFLEAQMEEAEPPGPHLFNVYVNGKLVLDHIDALSDAGAAGRLTSRVLAGVTAGPDGFIHLKFEQQGSKPDLVALEVLASESSTVRPVRIVAADHSVTDQEGRAWLADEFFVGGMLVDRKDMIRDEKLKDLYWGERYGNFSYRIPVPPGRYRVTLYFAEGYFSDTLPHARIFNVFADGVTLLRNFNVMQEAGGARRPVIRTFENLEPNAQGKIVLEFVPVANYAEVNAIEVTQMK
jgi:hypothetical protein